MSRPWQVWSLFALCLLLVVCGLSWLTVKAVELDRRQRLLAVRADFEGDVRLALRRMDLELAEILARETSWPPLAYRSFYLVDTDDLVGTAADVDPFGPPFADGGPSAGSSDPGKSVGKPAPAFPARQRVASPLLVPRSDFVQLYFQLDAANRASSPNCPPPDQQEAARRQGMTPELGEWYRARLSELQQLCDNHSLAELVPPIPAPAAPAAPAETKAVATSGRDQDRAPPQADQVANSPRPAAVKPQVPAAAPQLAQQSAQGPPTQYDQRISPREQQQRGSREYQTRKRQLDEFVSNYNVAVQQQQKAVWNRPPADSPAGPLPAADPQPGASRAVWVDGQLLLVRRVVEEGSVVLQGCWLDWPAIKDHLAAEVQDLIPQLDIVPVADESQADLTRMLATLPAELVVASPILADAVGGGPLSPLMFSLMVAWVCLSLAGIAAGVLLGGVMSLSERRAAFVSAVTHELRTPLTTFRMYAEMLADGMLPDASRRQQYLDTLKREADRLFHLVENVLSYARLERGQPEVTVSRVSVQQLVERMQPGLAERAAQADMQLEVDIAPAAAGCLLETDVAAVEQVMINLVDNACKYAGRSPDRRIHLEAGAADGRVLLQVRDHGPGIARHESRRLFRPFTKSVRQAAESAPGVGLGLALCRRIARQLHGQCYLAELGGDGATFVLTLPARPAAGPP